MKNIFLISLLITIFTTTNFAQDTVVGKNKSKNSKTENTTKSLNAIYFSEDFEGGVFPTGWTEDIGGATTGWTVGDDQSTQFWNIPDHTTYMAANDDLCNCDMSDFNLYTPTIDLSSAVSPIIKFDYYLQDQYGCLTSVLYSLDGGTTYSLLEDLEGNEDWENITLNFSAAANQANVKIAFHFNDQHEWTNGFVFDDFTVEDLPLTPNLEANIEGFVNEYFSVPLDQASFSPEGSVFNNTSALNENIDFELTVTGGYNNSQALSIPFEYYTRQNISFSPFTTNQEGNYTFEYNANYSSDLDPSDNTISKDIFFGGNELIRDNGIHEGNIGVTRDNAELGNIFTINAVDTLTSVKWKMTGTIGDEVSIVIREFNTEPGVEVGHSVTMVNDGSTGEYEANMQYLVILQPGKYFIGLQEGEHNMRLEYTTTEYTDSTCWGYWTDEAGDDHPGESYWRYLGGEGYGFHQTYYIRPQFANVVGANINEINANNFSIYPNPATNNLQFTISNEQLGESIEILDITGKVVIISSLRGDTTKQSVNISTLQKGVYFIKLNNKIHKFVKK